MPINEAEIEKLESMRVIQSPLLYLSNYTTYIF